MSRIIAAQANWSCVALASFSVWILQSKDIDGRWSEPLSGSVWEGVAIARKTRVTDASKRQQDIQGRIKAFEIIGS